MNRRGRPGLQKVVQLLGESGEVELKEYTLTNNMDSSKQLLVKVREFVCVFIHICTYVCTNTHIRTVPGVHQMNVRNQSLYVCIYIYIYIYISVCVCVRVCMKTNINACILTYISRYIYVCVYVHENTHKHKHTNIHAYPPTHSFRRPSKEVRKPDNWKLLL
jgi:hypothetical protein